MGIFGSVGTRDPHRRDHEAPGAIELSRAVSN
jgi:hypothetical protein